MLALADSYDEVRYPSFPRKQCHSAFVAALATIAGMQPAPVERWSVLEIGCGDGSNIIPLAFDYPDGKFIGLDRASSAVDNGRALASRLKLSNLDLQIADLRTWEPDMQFDYIIAHGVFSWVPQDVREKILKICSNSLKPQGIAFISYNAYPGCHFRKYAGDFLRFHVRQISDPAARMEKARGLAGRIVDQTIGEKSLDASIRAEMEVILEKKEAVLFHDDLADINEPFYLTDFVNQAACHGLQYLWDADPRRDDVRDAPLQAENWIESRQYLDFIEMRRFRESLLCRQGQEIDRSPGLDRFKELYVASQVQPAEPEKDGQQKFAFSKSGNLTTNHPLLKRILCHLAKIWPQSARISELPLDGYPAETIPDLLMRLQQGGALEIRVHAPKIAAGISDFPSASALARAQIAGGCHVITNQRHNNIELEDETIRTILMLLDGSRNRQEIVRDLIAAGLDQELGIRVIDQGLGGLHRMSLLTA
jgi:SAM-dependent methyltransferase